MLVITPLACARGKVIGSVVVVVVVVVTNSRFRHLSMSAGGKLAHKNRLPASKVLYYSVSFCALHVVYILV